MENALLASGEASGTRAGRGRESRARGEISAGGRGKHQAGPTREHKSAAETKSGLVALQFLLCLPPAACLPPPTWSLLAVVGRAVGVVARAPLLLRGRRGHRRKGRRQQRPVQAQPLDYCVYIFL